MAKQNKPRRTTAELLEAEQNRTKLLAVKLEQKQIKAALSYYAAADKGRRNKDWRAAPVSADQAIIPEAPVVNARARETVANTWIGKAAKRAQVRNVAGRGIEVVPTAKLKDGKEDAATNLVAATAWMNWAGAYTHCDIEGKRTFWQIQRTVVGEEFVTGISLVTWAYEPHPDYVGLRLQIFEYEQLDRDIQSFNGNQVRGGIEVNEMGAPIAYHFYRKNPNDYLSNSLDPIRIPAARVFVYFDAERVHQTIAISHLAPVLQDVRKFSRITNATLDRTYMESCIGFAIKKATPTSGGPLMVPRRAGDTGTTASGMKTIDFVPGMVPELVEGEEIQPFMPTSPGNQYEPFTDVTLRGIAAGIGMSVGALTRRTDGNYSGARQDMLEDQREFEPQQDALIDHLAKPVYELWYALAVMEGRFQISESDFASNRAGYLEAEYIPPARPWIDPEKEINAFAKGLEQRIVTRKEIIAARGGRFQNVIRQIAQEKDEAKGEGISFPEDQQAPAQVAQPVIPDTIQGSESDDATAALAALSDVPPNYRPATGAPSCIACKHYLAGKCSAYSNATVGDYFQCDAFQSRVKANGL